MRVLILGATGLLGRVLLEEWHTDEIRALGSCNADIRDRSKLHRNFADFRPECTVLAAAYTDVDGCERDLAGNLKTALRTLFVGTSRIPNGSERLVAANFRTISSDITSGGSR